MGDLIGWLSHQSLIFIIIPVGGKVVLETIVNETASETREHTQDFQLGKFYSTTLRGKWAIAFCF